MKRGNAMMVRTGFALLAGLVTAAPAAAQVSNDVVKLGVTNDQASIYSAAGGFGSVIAARMAAEDFGGTVLGKKIEIVFADNQTSRTSGSRSRGAGSTPRTSTRSLMAAHPRSAWRSSR